LLLYIADLEDTAERCPVNGHSFVHGVNIARIKAKLNFKVCVFAPNSHPTIQLRKIGKTPTFIDLRAKS